MDSYETYAVLDAQIRALTAKKEELRAGILEDMVENRTDKKDTSVGSFTIATLKTWTYTPAVAKLEEEYKTRKAIEENTGEATFVEKPSLRFTQIKL